VDTSTGRGIAGARVRIQSGNDEPLFTTADEHGHFLFVGVDLKSKGYQAEARYPGFMSASNAAGVSGATAVPSPDHPGVHIRLEMQRYGAIVGKVVDDVWGIPREGATVSALQRDESGRRRGGVRFEDGYQYVTVRNTQTDDLGEYRLAELGAGSYYVRIRTGTATPHDTFYPHALKLSDAMPVELAEGKELRADVRAIQGGVRISGRILGTASAQPGFRASVYIRSLSPGAAGPGSDSGSVTGDRFTVGNISPGKYEVSVEQYTSDGFQLKPLAMARRNVDVGTEDVDGIDLTLAPPPHVAGTVVFESGCAPQPVFISLNGESAMYRLHVAADGHFVLQDFFPGRYKMNAASESPGGLATSIKLGDAEVLTDGFELTTETKGPLRIAMSCPGR